MLSPFALVLQSPTTIATLVTRSQMQRRLLFPSFPGAWGSSKALQAEQGPGSSAAPNLPFTLGAPSVSFTIGSPPVSLDTRGLIDGRPANGVTRRSHPNPSPNPNPNHSPNPDPDPNPNPKPNPNPNPNYAGDEAVFYPLEYWSRFERQARLFPPYAAQGANPRLADRVPGRPVLYSH